MSKCYQKLLVYRVFFLIEGNLGSAVEMALKCILLLEGPRTQVISVFRGKSFNPCAGPVNDKGLLSWWEFALWLSTPF